MTPAIAMWRDRLIAADLAVDAARTDVDATVERLQAAVRERDRAAEHLAHLLGWNADEHVRRRDDDDFVRSIAATFGPETARAVGNIRGDHT
jgi:outer membrane protein TolC